MAKTAQPKTDRRKAPTRKKGVVSPTTVSDEAIAAKAFEYYCSRGGGHGQDIEDWLAAERELRAPSTESHASR